jgi:hypothetical protein
VIPRFPNARCDAASAERAINYVAAACIERGRPDDDATAPGGRAANAIGASGRAKTDRPVSTSLGN